MEIVIAIIGSGALSAVISGFFSWAQTKTKKNDAVSAGVQQLLYDRIKYLCKAHIKKGYIATNDLEDLERMHEIYHNDLNGNGFLDDLMSNVKKLTVTPAIIEKKDDNQ